MKRITSKFALQFCTLLAVTSLSAATKYWDTNDITAGAGGATPSGTWDTGTTANWTTDATGASAGTTWAANDVAVFSAGSDAIGSFTVTIPSGTTNAVSAITNQEGTILLGPGVVNFGAANGVFDVAIGATMNISGAGSGLVIGTGGITKNGGGVLFLGGTEAYSRASGAILTINAGTADFSGDTALGIAPASLQAAALTINGGTLRFSGAGTLALAANRGLTIGASGGTIEVVNNASISGLALNTGVTHAGSGTLTKTGLGRFSLGTTSTGFTGKYNILGGALNTASDLRLGPVPATTADYFTLNGSTAAIRISVTSGVTVNSARGITLGAGGGTLMQPGPGTLTYNGIIAGTSGGRLRLHWNDNADGTGGGGGTAGGQIVLGGANTYDGPTTVVSGTALVLNSAGALPSGNLTLNGGVLGLQAFGNFSRALGTGANQVQFSNNAGVSGGFAAYGAARSVNLGGASATLTWDSTAQFVASGSALLLGFALSDNTVDFQNPIDFNGAARTVQVDNGTAAVDAILSGQLSGTGSSGLTKSGAGTLQLNSTANNYAGNTTISAASTLQCGAAGVIPDTSVVIPGIAAAFFSLNGFNETVKSVSGTAGTIACGANTLTLDNPAGETYSSVFTGTAGGKIIKNGSGALTLSGSSSGWLGEFVLNNGTIGVGSVGTFGTAVGATLTINGGTLANINATGRTIDADVITTIAGNFAFDDSIFTTSANGNIAFGGPATLTGNRTITVNNLNGFVGNLIFTGAVGEDTAGRGILKEGVGTLALNNVANTYSGDTTINAGAISVDADGTFGNGAGKINLGGGNIIIAANRSTGANNIMNPVVMTANSEFSGSSTAGSDRFGTFGGTFTNTAGALTIRNTTATAIDAGFIIRLTNGVSFAGGINLIMDVVGNRSQLDVWNPPGIAQVYNGKISGAGTVRRSASNSGDGGLAYFNASDSDYSGGTALNDGGIAFGASTSGPDGAPTSGPIGIGTLSVSAQTFPTAYVLASGGARTIGNNVTLNNNLIIGGSDNLTLSGGVSLGASTRTITVTNSAASTLSGVIASTGGGLTKAGGSTLTLAGTNTYSGPTTVSVGTLALVASGSIGGSSSITVAAGATLDATGRTDGTLNVGSGQTLSGNGTVNGRIALNGTVAAGSSVGALTNVGAVVFNGGATNIVEINDAVAGPGVGWDLLSVTGGIDVQATSGSKFIVKLQSLNGVAPGDAANFTDPTNTAYAWAFATVTDAITNFSVAAFAVNATAFSNNLAGGHFVVGTNATQLLVVLATNVPPVAVTDSATRPADFSLKVAITNLLANDTDADAAFGDAVSFVGVGATSTNNASVSNDTVFVYYLPSNSDPTNNVADSFTYTISDNYGHQSAGTVLVTVDSSPMVSTNTVVSLEVGVPGANTNTLTFAGIPGVEYVTQFATNMPAVPWFDLSTNTAGVNGLWQVIDDTATNAMRFYRSLHR